MKKLLILLAIFPSVARPYISIQGISGNLNLYKGNLEIVLYTSTFDRGYVRILTQSNEEFYDLVMGCGRAGLEAKFEQHHSMFPNSIEFDANSIVSIAEYPINVGSEVLGGRYNASVTNTFYHDHPELFDGPHSIYLNRKFIVDNLNPSKPVYDLLKYMRDKKDLQEIYYHQVILGDKTFGVVNSPDIPEDEYDEWIKNQNK